jgi:hypothetical protein
LSSNNSVFENSINTSASAITFKVCCSKTGISLYSKGLWWWCITQNYWVFGLLLSFHILENRKHDVSETGSIFVRRWGGWHLSCVFCKGPNWVGVFPPSPEDGKRFGFRNVVFSIF